MPEDDWFGEAVEEIDNSPRAQRIRDMAQNRYRGTPPSTPPHPRDVKNTAEAFKAAKAKGAPIVQPTNPPRRNNSYPTPAPEVTGGPITKTPGYALSVLRKTVRDAGDEDAVRKAAAEWISKVTNDLMDIVSEVSETGGE